MPTPQPTLQNSTSPTRPLSVTFLTWVVLIITALNWLRLIEVIHGWTFLQTLSPAPLMFYLAIIGLFWGLLGAILVWGLFLGRSWSTRLMKGAAICYALYYWLDRLWVANSSAISSRWPFALGLTIVLLSLTFWILSRPKSQQFFNQTEN